MTSQKSLVLGLILLGLVAGSTAALLAQKPKPGGSQRPPVRTGADIVGKPPPSDALADLVVRRIDGGDLGPGNLVRFRVVNGGFGPASWGTVKIFIGKTAAEATFREEARYPALAQGQEVTVTASSATPESCRVNWVRVVVPGSSEESNLANNERSWQLPRVCPDLVVTGIKQNWEDRNTRYRVHVTVKNVGSVRMSTWVILSVHAWSSNKGCTFFPTWPWPIPPNIGSRDKIRIEPLNAGESVSVNIGAKHLASRTLCVQAYVDSQQKLEEDSEENNSDSRMFGPSVL